MYVGFICKPHLSKETCSEDIDFANVHHLVHQTLERHVSPVQRRDTAEGLDIVVRLAGGDPALLVGSDLLGAIAAGQGRVANADLDPERPILVAPPLVHDDFTDTL